MKLISLLANASGSIDNSLLAPLAGTGVTGVVLFWFMSRNEKRMQAFEASIDRNVRASLMLVLGFKQVSESIKDEARELLAEVDAKKK